MNKLFIIFLVLFFASCTESEKKLPILGERLFDGKDTVYSSIRNFQFLNQDSLTVSNSTFDNKVYVADFIFLSCPSICPLMNKNMLTVYRQFEKNNQVLFLSHTIDPEHDSIKRLKAYSENLNVSSQKWHFVTGNADSVYAMAEKNYFAAAYKDSTAPGGFVHSGGLLLVDKYRHIRGVYDGTDSLEARRLIGDLNKLLKEQF